jgi:hypothetical protein
MFLKSGSAWNVTTPEAMDLHEKLPAGNYVVKKNPMTGQFFLEGIDSFPAMGKVYGETLANTDRILTTFMDRSASTGVMLAGEKGSGKSLLAKSISIKAAEQGIPTIVINAPWAGDVFNSFMQMINQPCIVLFDEFEKVYDRETQEHILTLLDGVFPSKKLFVLTCNDKWRVDSHMRNRPGRIFYMLDFKGLEEDFIVEYCNDNLKDKTQSLPVARIANMFEQFNFDMLKALVEEMNRFGETPQQALKMLNTKPEFGGDSKYEIKLVVAGEPIDVEKIDGKTWTGNPFTNNVVVNYKVDDSEDPDGWNWEDRRFANRDLKQIDSTNGRFVFANSDGDTVVLTRVKEVHKQVYWD